MHFQRILVFCGIVFLYFDGILCQNKSENINDENDSANTTQWNIEEYNITDHNIIKYNITDYNITDYNITDYSITDYNITDYHVMMNDEQHFSEHNVTQRNVSELNVTEPTTRKPVKFQISLRTTALLPCPKNMTLYQTGENKTVCDCFLTFLYHASTDSCYEAYRQGPCKEKEYFVLPEKDADPKCEKNPCEKDGHVPYNGTCYDLFNINNPCGMYEILSVHEKTLQLYCRKIELVPFMIVQTPKTECPAGSRRNSLGICKEVLTP